ncbi:carbohydrate-binding protein [Tolypothrix sp. PCC 7910]|uniref:carbohydrate-binding protein n=1 Tax=Tolypothrix sp. PCC 7910 TaxID=2099387 RepID=UPI0014276F11|nr:carbohydrate-binding protein [Tolypothrix sp. PCC 7910]QIR36749.1 carbohydrate-binding protein [Tolypothrix sp. PCC 7910]
MKHKLIKFCLHTAISLLLSLSGFLYLPISVFTPIKLAEANSTLTIPPSALAPWPVFKRVDALNSSFRYGLNTVYGDYWERSENPFSIGYTGQSQELTNTANGNYAVYNDLDLGSGVEALMLRIALPSGTNSVEVRLGSVSGLLVGRCTINSTGSQSIYRTVPCPLNNSLAKGKQNLVIKFTGINSTMRFNWFAFWAKDTVQKIDEIQKVQSARVNQGAPVIPISGRPIRTQNLLPDSSQSLAKSYGLWSPGKTWECPKWMHDTYLTKGEDGKIYPTWHPPVDFNPETNTYCTYGHEHGDDPASSEVFDIAGMPAFGYVNEQLTSNNPSNPSVHRHEDHFGHKVLVANNWQMYNANNSSVTKTCDISLKLHMGTHSPDALVNTAHEMFASGKCDGFEPFKLQHFALFGAAGSFKEAETSLCNLAVNPGLTPSPTNQPNGGVHRAIPTADCYQRGTLDQQTADVNKRTVEYWLTSFAGKSFYFNITNPSRFYDALSSTKINRTVNACYNPAHPLSQTLLCQETLAAGSTVEWDDPRSPFRGTTQLQTHFAGLAFSNSANSVIYTDVYGKNARMSPAPELGITLKQIVPVQGFDYKVDGQASLFADRDYSALGQNGVRAPN